jgi:hypothetical protein
MPIATAAQLDAGAVLDDVYSAARRLLAGELGRLEGRRRRSATRRGSWRSEGGLLAEQELVIATVLEVLARAARAHSAGTVFTAPLVADFQQSFEKVLRVAD